jgi:hypothetical protein
MRAATGLAGDNGIAIGALNHIARFGKHLAGAFDAIDGRQQLFNQVLHYVVRLRHPPG